MTKKRSPRSFGAPATGGLVDPDKLYIIGHDVGESYAAIGAERPPLVADADGLVTVRMLCTVSAKAKVRKPFRCLPEEAGRLIDQNLAHQPAAWLQEQLGLREQPGEPSAIP